MPSYDAVVIGAGFAGAIVARELAERGEQRVLLLEQRSHIGGNAYDALDDAGILVHRYGPHIFHTENERVYHYLSRFTSWRDYPHRVVANIHDMLIPVPFNLRSLRLVFGEGFGTILEQKLLKTYGMGRKVTILELRAAEDPDLALVASYIYKNVFLQYTMKQWGTTPEQIDPAVTARVPVLLSTDDRYFQDKYQGMPKDGYTTLFASLLDHKNIDLSLNTPCESRMHLTESGIAMLDNEIFEGPIVYTGALDELFHCRYGRLPYRTLDFRFETIERERFQMYGTVNYTVSEDFTRITEFKHLTGQQHPYTSIVREYPRAYEGLPGEVPYYAINSPENQTIYQTYRTISTRYMNLHLLGRLAEYQYYNMDAITEKALLLSDQLLARL